MKQLRRWTMLAAAATWTASFLAAPAAAAKDANARSGSDEGEEREGEHDWDKPEWFWMAAEGGVQTIDLRTFEADFDQLTVGFLRGTGTGPSAGAALGARLAFVTLGVRGRFASFRDDSVESTAGGWQLWSLDGELGLRFPIRRVQPYLTFAAGYSALGELDDAVRGLGNGLDVRGANARAGLGFDYYVNPTVSLGAQATGEVLMLSRPGVSLRELAEARRVGTINEAEARILEADGSSVGTSFTFTAGPGFHF
jgi:hypothetical protein